MEFRSHKEESDPLERSNPMAKPKKMLAVLMSALLVFSLTPAAALTAFADDLAAAQADFAPQDAGDVTTTQVGECNWTFDNSTGTLTIAPAQSGTAQLTKPNTYPMPIAKVKKLVFEGSLELVDSQIFENFKRLETIVSTNNSNVKCSGNCMRYLFNYCSSLADISALANWDTSSVTNMEGLFYDCSSLISVSDLAGWDTSGVTDMSGLFCGCSSLTDVSGLADWDTSKVTDMGFLFNGCSSLADISGLANWSTSIVANMSSLFWKCLSLADVSAFVNWDTSNVTNMKHLFYCCSSLVDLSGLANWDTSSVTDMGGLFYGCSSLSDVSGLANWNTSNVTNMESFFSGCSSLSNVSGLANWDTSSVEDMGSLFCECSSLADVSGLAKWDTSIVTNMGNLLFRCASLADVSALASWKTPFVTDMTALFYDCSSLTDFSVLAGWDTRRVTSMLDAFAGCLISKITFGVNWRFSDDGGFGLDFDDGPMKQWISQDAVVKGPLTTEQLVYGWDPATMAGTWTVVETPSSEDPEKPNNPDNPQQPTYPSLGMASVTVPGVTYTGKALTPVPVVRLGNSTLRAGTDFTVSYRNNVNAGTGTVVVTGKGAYTGSRSATFAIAKASLAKAKVTGLGTRTYAGKALRPAPAVKLGSLGLKAGRDYAVAYRNNKNAGTARVVLTGKGNFTGSKTATFKIAKAKQPMTAKAKAPTLKRAKVKKASQAIAKSKAFSVAKAQGKVTFKKVSGSKKIAVSSAGKVTVKKGLGRGTYAVKVKVSAKGTANYKAGSKTVTLKVRIR